MKEKLLRHPIVEGILYLLCWGVFAALTGTAGGFLGGLFARAIRLVTGLRAASPWVMAALPLCGLAIVWLYQVTGEEKNRGVNMVLASISAGDRVTMATGPLIFVSSILSHLGGASVGREGASLQLGGWLGARLAELTGLDEKNKRVGIMCGMAAVFAAVFGTPVAAAIFCIEVISVGVFYYAALVPCMFSALIGSQIGGWMGRGTDSWLLSMVPSLAPKYVLLSVLLGILCALLSVVMTVSIHSVEKGARKYLKNPYLRVVAAAVLTGLLTMALGTQKYTGAGINLVDDAMSGTVDEWAFVLKLLFTCIAVAGGFRGGEIVPTLAIGASFGALFGQLTAMSKPLGAACGMIALFAGVTNCPIASLMIAMEMFHGTGLPYFMITVSLSFALSGYYGLYGTQRFAYSKTKNEYIGDR